MSLEAMRESLGVDSLGYLSLEGLRACVEDPHNYCSACFDGDYPVDPFGAEEAKARRRAALPEGDAVISGRPGQDFRTH